MRSYAEKAWKTLSSEERNKYHELVKRELERYVMHYARWVETQKKFLNSEY